MEKGVNAGFVCLIMIMNKTRQIITSNEKEFPHFRYYLTILDKIEENTQGMPDISVESCKSLIEGISKTILNKLGEPYVEKGRNADSPSSLLKKVLDRLSDYSSIDVVFVQTSCSFALRTSEIRNERGDISHGKLSPKEANSDPHLAEMVAHITDGIVCYILKIFFKTDWSHLDKLKYTDNAGFNDFLDSQNEWQGVRYSKALFDQDLISYTEQLNDYLSAMEEEKKYDTSI